MYSDFILKDKFLGCDAVKVSGCTPTVEGKGLRLLRVDSNNI